MVAYNAIAADPHINPLDTFSENRFGSTEISILVRNSQPPISTIKNVINISAHGYPLRSTHEASKKVPGTCNSRTMGMTAAIVGTFAMLIAYRVAIACIMIERNEEPEDV
jgi:hypothetical protein